MQTASFSFFTRPALLALALCFLAPAGALAHEARVQVQDAWARATVPGQGGTGAFMTLQANHDLELVGASSPVAGVAQVHEMKLEGDTMRMHAVPSLKLGAGQSVTLKPGGHHIMLLDLKQPLKAGTQIDITLQLRDAQGASLNQTVQVPVRQNAPHGAPDAGAAQHHGS
ncbi:copper chaperone PCu(A)C [Comamonas sp. NLF-1-9]|uniref:copper chaperone PCu(A)C n=1 Tax=Comamonas sp. NLF-1-9 TaxID=2853163 RepID=UPI001C45C71A|nr:copper chaperone PCu(A)C [Comamonas sp. NLF-1-9]QXL84254.1 copper chaperone PCu(A)C [Comamonas sp. NLF-1-9]